MDDDDQSMDSNEEVRKGVKQVTDANLIAFDLFAPSDRPLNWALLLWDTGAPTRLSHSDFPLLSVTSSIQERPRTSRL